MSNQESPPEEIRMLVVDDNPAIHEDIKKTLGPKQRSDALKSAAAELFGSESEVVREDRVYLIDSAQQGEDGFDMVRAAREEGNPYRFVLMDVRMPPGWDGVETTEKVFEADPDVQVVLCTAYADYSIGQIVERFGSTDRLLILKKPFDIAEVTLLARSLSERWRLQREAAALIEEQQDQIVDLESVVSMVQQAQDRLKEQKSNLEERSYQLSTELQHQSLALLETRQVTMFALAHLAESRDPETGEHLFRMQAFTRLLAEELFKRGDHEEIDQRFIEDLYRAAPLHDIGKVGIPDSVLLKAGRLTSSEFDIMKRHTLIGAHALETAAAKTPHGEFLYLAADVARHHHEKWDGSGYPLGLRGESIPLAARIAAVADCFDAITSARVYKDAMPPEKARDIIVGDAGTHFDPDVVDAMLVVFDEMVETKLRIDGEAPSHSAGAQLV